MEREGERASLGVNLDGDDWRVRQAWASLGVVLEGILEALDYSRPRLSSFEQASCLFRALSGGCFWALTPKTVFLSASIRRNTEAVWLFHCRPFASFTASQLPGMSLAGPLNTHDVQMQLQSSSTNCLESLQALQA